MPIQNSDAGAGAASNFKSFAANYSIDETAHLAQPSLDSTASG
jgi:hypothetical protein